MNEFDLFFDVKVKGHFVKYKNNKGTTSIVSVSYLIRNKDRLKYDKDSHLQILDWLKDDHLELYI